MSQPKMQFSEGNSKALWLLALTLSIALVFTGSALTQSKQQAPPAPPKKAAGLKPKPVKIKCANGAITVDVKSQPIIKGIEEVVWTAVGSNCTGWKVTFNKPEGSPFASTEFYEGKNSSGDAVGKANQFGYRYTVTVPHLPDLDPDVIIKGSGMNSPKL